MKEQQTAALLEALGSQAQQASYQLASLSSQQKNRLLKAIAAALTENSDTILAANQEDISQAKENGLTPALIDRLLLDAPRLKAIIADIDNVIALADPIGKEFDNQLLDTGLRLSKRAVPLGVIGVIYEARPNVTVDIATLALKTGNAVILRGGKETLNSNRVLCQVIRQALTSLDVDANAVQLIDNPDRSIVSGLLRLDQYVDMIVPRGGQHLQRLCAEQSSIPVILGGIGICHLYVDEHADLEKSIDVIANAKVQRPTVCNALDTLLVHRLVAEEFIPRICQHLHTLGVRFVGCQQVLDIVDAQSELSQVIDMQLVQEGDYDQEWLGLTLGIRVVETIDTAICHIRRHSSGHSEAILTDSVHKASHFMNQVDSSAVYVNASTRFTDGGQFGLGAEVAVSTQKLHARGPMGLEALTTYKWLAWGDYTSR
ncbi:glutamate-5-semialdehyde dehydrogenase [Shewanella gelidii]|uniref:Gamma-glutamyl phosphate reductase n=1 Tax=Shewanella gelidii TaxID=1642821 RepID=A0A917JJQ0_9GAMM|nr:glutamate-5-semialdehyde dehydrogenase [Shewanella gelidii]MCL1097118.1 glutamate-5-semialdehyde dehydrogenase [Shewanella gelidii]GGI72676.1 gamma-glutamyl phosphate reductase [Shewanella gelidii]